MFRNIYGAFIDALKAFMPDWTLRPGGYMTGPGRRGVYAEHRAVDRKLRSDTARAAAGRYVHSPYQGHEPHVAVVTRQLQRQTLRRIAKKERHDARVAWMKAGRKKHLPTKPVKEAA